MKRTPVLYGPHSGALGMGPRPGYRGRGIGAPRLRQSMQVAWTGSSESSCTAFAS